MTIIEKNIATLGVMTDEIVADEDVLRLRERLMNELIFIKSVETRAHERACDLVREIRKLERSGSRRPRSAG